MKALPIKIKLQECHKHYVEDFFTAISSKEKKCDEKYN